MLFSFAITSFVTESFGTAVTKAFAMIAIMYGSSAFDQFALRYRNPSANRSCGTPVSDNAQRIYAVGSSSFA